jgi:hypothetical protein
MAASAIDSGAAAGLLDRWRRLAPGAVEAARAEG